MTSPGQRQEQPAAPIRVHLAHIGHPIVADKAYSGRDRLPEFRWWDRLFASKLPMKYHCC